MNAWLTLSNSANVENLLALDNNYSIYLFIKFEGRIKNNTQVLHRVFYMGAKSPRSPSKVPETLRAQTQ